MSKEVVDAIRPLVPLKKDIAKYKREETRAFVRARGRSLIILNDTAATIFELCDGVRSIEDIALVLKKQYPDIPLERIQADTIIHVRDLQKEGLLDLV